MKVIKHARSHRERLNNDAGSGNTRGRWRVAVLMEAMEAELESK